jgi:hypothetical protein
VESQEKLVEKWWQWWASLASEWRKKDEEGRPAIGEETGDWGVLAHLGGNGMLMVLLLLVWWRQGETIEVASEDWVTAVCDVAWVLKGLLSAVRSPSVLRTARHLMAPANHLHD